MEHHRPSSTLRVVKLDEVQLKLMILSAITRGCLLCVGRTIIDTLQRKIIASSTKLIIMSIILISG